MLSNTWVYDIETLASCFTYTGINVESEEVVQYVIHKEINDRVDLINHLKSCKGQIGFNNINFDYPIIHYLLTNYSNSTISSSDLCVKLYNKAREIIDSQNKDVFTDIVAIKQKDILIKQLDLFKVWHYNNKNRKTSLKALEISMNYPNVMEMPIDHTRDDISIEEINDILA